ncbi:MAG: DUF1566 domain-containing protein [Rhodoferax sp.]|nr:DUF1566 domain-containing protein [Rhodoferax sp.]
MYAKQLVATLLAYTLAVALAACGGGGEGIDAAIASRISVRPVAQSIGALLITAQPTNQTVSEGDPAQFTVNTAGTDPLSYQWKKDGNDIAGATSSTYTIPSTALEDTAKFSVTVTSTDGMVTSNAATLTVTTVVVAPTITTQPTDLAVNAGQKATFSVTATGTSPSYQWQRNGSDISGATSSTYTLPVTTMEDNNAVFTVVIGNKAGTVTSNTATLTVHRYSRILKTTSGLPYFLTECVKDNVTGLVWEGKNSNGNIIRPGDGVYTNYDSTTSAQKLMEGTAAFPTQTDIDASTNSIGYTKSVNDIALCGFTDWRLPTKEELPGLVDGSQSSGPTIDNTWFPNTQSTGYWTSSPYTHYSGIVWGVSFEDGKTYIGYGRGSHYAIRLVRGGVRSEE